MKSMYIYDCIYKQEIHLENLASAFIIDKKNDERYSVTGFYGNGILNGLLIYYLKKGGKC